MRSMTGYGRATTALGALTLTLQVTSVNRKTLDLTTKLPAAWEGVEASILETVRKVAIPVAAGRNLAVLLEAAVRSTILQFRGIDNMQEFITRQQKLLLDDDI